MAKLYSIYCPKCNNNHLVYLYGKDTSGLQKYLCRKCKHQFFSYTSKSITHNYPRCLNCGKASFLHHDYLHYSNFRCVDKKCYHSFFVHKANAACPLSMSVLFGKTDFKRTRYPVFVLALSMFYLGKNSFINIALIFNIRVSHTTVSNGCTNFAPIFDNLRLKLLPCLSTKTYCCRA